MKPLFDHSPPAPVSFGGDLQSRLELVHDRVGAEIVHLDQVAAVAQSYAVPLPVQLRLVR